MKKRAVVFIALLLIAGLGVVAASAFDALRSYPATEIVQIFFENDPSEFRDLAGGGGFRMDNGAFKGCDTSFVCESPRLRHASEYAELGEQEKRELLQSMGESLKDEASHFRPEKDARILVGSRGACGGAMLISNVKTKYQFFAPPGIGASIYAMGYKMRQAAASQKPAQSQQKAP